MAVSTHSTETDATALYRTRHDPTDSEPVSRTLYTALAAVEGVSPSELDLTLYDSVDVDAIDALFRANETADWQFTATVERYEIRIHADGRVAVSSAVE
ncbi:HalOD1 output domain-containing protein [Halorussus caseinilyticus]|uniref:HalOD1 output domain-containing protein n=1 Tax=Halorussus caseinilyticus TaxID=3034025 RepID=A0ABD5WR99_9EURY|nr:HalOD1 output domain-containing protein [Halorussus sp. DT72]